jgi:hypothetical protein
VRLAGISGVVEHGLFIGLVAAAITSSMREHPLAGCCYDGPRRAKSRKLLSGRIVKHGRQFAWHVDHDAMTAAHFHDLPSATVALPWSTAFRNQLMAVTKAVR